VSVEVIASALAAIRSHKGWAHRAVAQLPDEKLNVAVDANANRIAVIMLRVADNFLSQWTDFFTNGGEQSSHHREQDLVDSLLDRRLLLDYRPQGWSGLFDTLSARVPSDLAKTVLIRGESHSVPLAIHRSPAHCAYHVRQIVIVARVLAGEQRQTITVPRGGSRANNDKFRRRGHCQSSPSDFETFKRYHPICVRSASPTATGPENGYASSQPSDHHPIDRFWRR
jgi:hypothetical protein